MTKMCHNIQITVMNSSLVRQWKVKAGLWVIRRDFCYFSSDGCARVVSPSYRYFYLFSGTLLAQLLDNEELGKDSSGKGHDSISWLEKRKILPESEEEEFWVKVSAGCPTHRNLLMQKTMLLKSTGSVFMGSGFKLWFYCLL